MPFEFKLDQITDQFTIITLSLDQKVKRPQTDEERMALVDELKQLFKETQELYKDNPITDEEIQAEIDAYRRGE